VDEEIDLERTCIVTRDKRDPAELIRFVASPDGVATPDLKRKLPGRGAWVAARADIVARLNDKQLSRALKRPTTIPPGLADTVERLLRRDALQALALDRRNRRRRPGHRAAARPRGG